METALILLLTLLILLIFIYLLYLLCIPKIKTQSKVESEPFTIELYPKTNRYVVKYKNKGWLSQYGNVIVVRDDFMLADFYKSELYARHAIEVFKEQQFKEGVQIIKY